MKTERKSELLRIVPPEPKAGATLTQGTQVLTESGVPISGITKIVLTAEVNDIWRAEISCYVQPPDITCMASVSREFVPTRWQRFKGWLRYGRKLLG